jgi:hypothetical protein
MSRVSSFPPSITDDIAAKADTARYVVPLSSFQRPRLYVVGGGEFEWPLGTEGMRLSGAATLAEHKYISDNAPSIQVTHRDASTIELSGVFPGRTGAENVRALKQMLVQVDPPDSKRLELPGILTQAQKVVADSWEFSRIEESKWDFQYTVTFRIIGVTTSKSTPGSPTAPTGPKGNPKGKTIHQMTVVQGIQTLRMASFQVYGNPDRWKEIYELNKLPLSKLFPNALISQMPTKVLPLGFKLKYAS